MIKTYDKEIKQLNRTTQVRIMLPFNYDESKSYPVLYMHDGQNLYYDKDASYGHSWRFIDNFKEHNLPEIIVVGIDCAPGLYRLDEYSPWINTTLKDTRKEMVNRDVGGQGDIYLDWLVNELKPWVDNEFSTKTESLYTAIGGSSMGGLISTYALFKYPNVFTRAAAVSNAYWFAEDEMIEFISKSNSDHVKYLYLDVGTKEIGIEDDNEIYINTNKSVYEALKAIGLSSDRLKFDLVEGGVHNEADWSKRVHTIINWIYKDL